MIRRNRSALVRLAGAALVSLALVGCSKIGESYQRGYIIDEAALASVKKGASAEQVLHTMGTPSTSSTVGNKTWYYISESSHRKAQFLPENIDERRVVAIYFNSGMRVERTALYGLQDGVPFDFISRATPAAGVEQNFIGQLFRGLTRFDPITN